MAVSVRFALTTLGEPISLPQDLGTHSPGGSSSEFNAYISHTGTAPITDCAWYIKLYEAGIYLGSRTAQEDFNTVIGWGDDSYPAPGGGFYLNQDFSGGFPAGSWEVFRTGYGDAVGAAIPLAIEAINLGAAVAGEIAPGGEANVRFRLDVPALFTDVGTFYIDVRFDYSSTS